MKVIITGATGLVGEGVLLTCLQDSRVKQILIISRKHLDLKDDKVNELILSDFNELGNHSHLFTDYDACFFCAGASSVGETEESFTKKTFDFVVPFATTLAGINPNMVFIYVSGNRTDSTEKGKVMWARVKGRTENALMKLPFRSVYNFRPGFMRPLKKQRNVRGIYRVFDFLSPVWYLLVPNWICKMEEVGKAMINTVERGYTSQIIEVNDIKKLANN